MSEFISTQLLPALLSNFSVGLILLAIALIVRFIGNRPQLEHLVWLLLLAKLISPPLINLPVFSYDRPALVSMEAPTASSAGKSSIAVLEKSPFDVVETAFRKPPKATFDRQKPDHQTSASALAPQPKVALKTPSITADTGRLAGSTAQRTSVIFFPINIPLETYVALAWLIGSTVVLCWSFVRLFRFQQLLRVTSQDAAKGLALQFDSVASRMGVRSIPELLVVSSRISPFVWWVGGKTQVFVPQTLVETLSQSELNQVFAHELAHVRRRDYLVRWFELTCVVLLWWNPLVWISQRYLRSAEEACCDAMVLSSLDVTQRDYGATLLLSVESLMELENRPPAIASGISSGGSLERRIKMILSSSSSCRLSLSNKLVIIGVAMAIVPLGFVTAQSTDKATLTKDSSPATVLTRSIQSIPTKPFQSDSGSAKKIQPELSKLNNLAPPKNLTSSEALPSSTPVLQPKNLTRAELAEARLQELAANYEQTAAREAHQKNHQSPSKLPVDQTVKSKTKDPFWEEVPSLELTNIRSPTSDQKSWLREHLSVAVDKGKITDLQMQLMINSLSEGAAAKPHPLKRLYNAANYFSATARRLNAAFNRVQSTYEEVEHFKRLSNEGIESLDVALDTQRRHFQAEIVLATLLFEIHKSHEELKKQIAKSVSTNKLDDLTAHTMTVDHKKQMLDIIEKLGPRFQYYVEKTQLWLAKEQVSKAVRARAVALETWRIVQQQHKNGAEVTVQQVAQASEQYHYFDAAVTEAMSTLASEKTTVE